MTNLADFLRLAKQPDLDWLAATLEDSPDSPAARDALTAWRQACLALAWRIHAVRMVGLAKPEFANLHGDQYRIDPREQGQDASIPAGPVSHLVIEAAREACKQLPHCEVLAARALAGLDVPRDAAEELTTGTMSATLLCITQAVGDFLPIDAGKEVVA